MQEVLRPLRALTAHCSSLSSSGPRRLLLPPSDTSAEPSWGYTWTHQDSMGSRLKWVSQTFLIQLFIFSTFQAASINTVALPVTTSALVVFILLPLAQAQEVSLQQLCCRRFDCSLLLHAAYQNLFLSKQILAWFFFPIGILCGVLHLICFFSQKLVKQTGCGAEKHLLGYD